MAITTRSRTPRQQVLEHEGRGVAQRRPDDRGPLGDRDRPAHDLGRRLGRQGDRGEPVERADEAGRVERRARRRGRAPASPRPRAAAGSRRKSPIRASAPPRPAAGRRRGGAVDDQPGAQLGLGVDALVGERRSASAASVGAAASPGS